MAINIRVRLYLIQCLYKYLGKSFFFFCYFDLSILYSIPKMLNLHIFNVYSAYLCSDWGYGYGVTVK